MIVETWYWLKASTAFHHPAKASSAGLLPSSGAEEMLPQRLVRDLLLLIFYISVVTGLDHPCEPKESFSLVLVRDSEFLALLFLKWNKETSVSHCSGQR